MSKRLLVDMQGYLAPSMMVEDVNGHKEVVGEFGKADIPTANGRIYPRKIWEREIQKIKQDMDEGKVFGHLNHPADGKTDLNKVAHIMKQLWIEDDGRVMGRARILNNKHGDQLLSIYEAGGKVGVSSRGMGSTKVGEGGNEIVDDDYSYMTHDFVADPAVKTSYPEITGESKQESKPVVVEIQQHEQRESVMGQVITEQDVTKRVEESKVALKQEFETNLTEKLVLLRESIEKEVRAELMTNPEIVGAKATVDQIVAAVKPFITKEDVDVASRDKEITDLKAQLEAKNVEITKVQESAKEIMEGAKRLGLVLFYERTLAKEEDRAELAETVGSLNQYKTEEEISEAIKKGKKKVDEKKAKKLADKKKMEDIQAAHASEVKALKEDNEKKNKALLESLGKQKAQASKLYLEDRIKGNPNALIIRKLCEGIDDKKKIDLVITEHSVAGGAQNLYNNVQSRLARLDEVSKESKSLVETQLQEANGPAKLSDLDAEIAAVLS